MTLKTRDVMAKTRFARLYEASYTSGSFPLSPGLGKQSQTQRTLG